MLEDFARDLELETFLERCMPIFQLIGDIEVYLAALGFRRMAAGAGLEVCLPELSSRGGPSLLGRAPLAVVTPARG